MNEVGWEFAYIVFRVGNNAFGWDCVLSHTRNISTHTYIETTSHDPSAKIHFQSNNIACNLTS